MYDERDEWKWSNFLRDIGLALFVLFCWLGAMLAFRLCWISAVQSAHAGPLEREVLRPAVALKDNKYLSSGVVVQVATAPPRKLVLTCAHCCEPDQEMDVISRRGSKDATSKAKVVWRDVKADLALLKPQSEDSLVAALIPEVDAVDVRPGRAVWYCGSGGGLTFSLVKSIVNQHKGGWLLVNGEGHYGHSGSGVFVRKGGKYLLVGVLRGGWDKSPKTPVACVPLEKIREHLDGYMEDQKLKKDKKHEKCKGGGPCQKPVSAGSQP